MIKFRIKKEKTISLKLFENVYFKKLSIENDESSIILVV